MRARCPRQMCAVRIFFYERLKLSYLKVPSRNREMLQGRTCWPVAGLGRLLDDSQKASQSLREVSRCQLNYLGGVWTSTHTHKATEDRLSGLGLPGQWPREFEASLARSQATSELRWPWAVSAGRT